MGSSQSVCHLSGDGEPVAEFQEALICDHLPQARTAQQFHDEIGSVSIETRVVDGNDIGMDQTSSGDGFPTEPRNSFRILVCQRDIQCLDRHQAFQLDVEGLPNRAYAAKTNPLIQPISLGQQFRHSSIVPS